MHGWIVFKYNSILGVIVVQVYKIFGLAMNAIGKKNRTVGKYTAAWFLFLFFIIDEFLMLLDVRVTGYETIQYLI